MPGSVISVFSEAEDFAAALREEGCLGLLVTGRGSFRDAHTLDITRADVTDSISAEYFVVAVGSEPARPPEIPFDGHTIITSDEVFRLGYLPRSMIIVGGGVIGTEYASMIATLGVQMTLVEGRLRVP